MTHLDEKAVEAAWDTLPQGSTLISRKAFRCAIRAYLSALPYSPVGDLVDATMQSIAQQCMDEQLFLGTVNAREVIRKHIESTLTTLSTRNAELEREVKRLRDLLQEIEDSADLTAAMSGHLYDRLIDALSTSPQGGEHE